MGEKILKVKKLAKKLLSLALCLVLLAVALPTSVALALEEPARQAGVPQNSLITDGSFEGYNVGQKLTELTDQNKWYGVNEKGESPSWITATLSDTPVCEGKRSLALNCIWNSCYRLVTGLKTNTDYAFSFNYYLGGDDSLRIAAVIAGSSEVTHNATNSITKKTDFTSAQNDKWNSQTLTFNSGNNTEVYILFGYNPGTNSGNLYLDNIGVYEVSTVTPSYDSTLGSVTSAIKDGKVMMTAAASKTAGFRGWYVNGNEIGSGLSIDVNPWYAKNYTAMFYDYNIIENGGFENYSVGQSIKGLTGNAVWEGYCDSEKNGGNDWTTFTVTDTKKHSGEKSLKATFNYNAGYCQLKNLAPNTQYKLSFYYSLDVYANPTPNQLVYAAIIKDSDSISVNGNKGGAYLAAKSFDSTSGTTADNEWKQLTFSFYTAENTDFKLILSYNSDGSDSQLNNIYIDDLCLVRDELAKPEYSNADFEDGVPHNFEFLWQYMSTKVETNDTYTKRLELTPKMAGGVVSSSPYHLKKGYAYRITYDLDLSKVTDKMAPINDYSTNTLKKDENGNIIYSTTAPNWFNWSFSKIKNTFGETKYATDNHTILSSEQFYAGVNKDATGFNYSVKTKAGKVLLSGANYISSKGFDFYGNSDYSQPVVVTSYFIAPESGPMWINFRLNGLGTYYIDNLTVTEETAPAEGDKLDIESALNPVGIAIRLTGAQGIRYKTNIDKRILCADNPYGYRATEYGTVAIKSEYLGGKELVVGGKYSYGGKERLAVTGPAYVLGGNLDKVFSEYKTSIDYTGVLMNIKGANWADDYTMRSYLKYIDKSGNPRYVYSDTFDSSIYTVAKEAYSAKRPDGSFNESDTTREYLYDSILSLSSDRQITIDNSSNFLYTGFDGITSTIYHGFTFMPDSHGRTYTEEQAAIEMDRLVDSGITSVRTIFKSQWAAKGYTSHYTTTASGQSVKDSETFTGWDWNTTEMKAFYKWAKMLQDRNIDIILNVGWHLHFISDRDSSIPEIFYLLGYEEGYSDDKNFPGTTIYYGNSDKYSEASYYSFTGKETVEERRLILASLRYGEWVRQGLEALENNGIYNVTYIHPFTETGYEYPSYYDDKGNYVDGDLINPTYRYADYVRMVQGLHDILKINGVRSKYEIIGPSQSIYKNLEREKSLLEYYLEWEQANPSYKGMIDILSSHHYAKSQTTGSIYDPDGVYNMSNDSFGYYNDIINGAGGLDGREFWCDEYFSAGNDVAHVDGIGMHVTQFAAGLVAAIENCVSRVVPWQIFDQLWTPQNGTGGEFIGGVHACGTAPSFATIDDVCPKVAAGDKCSCQDYKKYASYSPRVNYYGLNLLGKYLSNQNASVYRTSVSSGNDGGIFVTSMLLGNEKTAILAVNTNSVSKNLSFSFTNSVKEELLRYTYNPKGITPTDAAKSVPSDGIVTVKNNSFYDTIAPGSFAIYISNIADTDVDVDMTE